MLRDRAHARRCYESRVIASPVRLRSTVALAVLAHVIVAASLLAVRVRGMASALVIEAPIEIGVEVVEVADPEVAPSAGPATTRASGAAPHQPFALARPGSTPSPSATNAAEVATTDGPATWSFDPVRAHSPVDLGLDPRKPLARMPGPGEPTRPQREAVDRALHGALSARDLGLGLGRASVLVSAAREAASSPRAPDVGAVTFDIACDAGGVVRTAHADDHAWNDVGAALILAMSGKTVRVREGSRGLRARLRIVAARTPPSGGGGSTNLGAVPDDVAGGNSRACEGTGWTRRCVAGMPLGVTSAEHDAANAGAKTTRVVHVQVLDETEI